MAALSSHKRVFASLMLSAFLSPLSAAELVNLDEQGSGFIATYEHLVVSADAPRGSVEAWRFNVDNVGDASLTNAWMIGYNGGVSFSDMGNWFEITNQGSGFKPDTDVGSTLKFVLQGQGDAFNAADFAIEFENLDPVGNGSFITGYIGVNDWYSPSSGGGFNVTYQCTVDSNIPIEEFIVEFNYSGSGVPTRAWANSYNGDVESGYIGRNGGYAIRSASTGHTPTLKNGDTFQVSLNVQGAGFDSADFDVSCRDAANRAPVADAGADVEIVGGSVISLNGSGSTDEDGDALSYQWVLASQPDSSDVMLEDESSVSPSLSVDQVGTYVIQLVVSDGFLSSEADEVIVTVLASTLAAIPRAVPSSGDAPLRVVFSPDASTDTAIEVYEWDFDGDGTIDRRETVGSNASFIFRESGIYTTTLRVTDSSGNSSTASIVISVGNEPPIVTAEASPSNGEIPLTVSFSASASDTNGIADYSWDFDGDGITDSTTTGSSVSFTYDTEGVFSPSITVTDTLGAASVLQVPSVEVRATPPGSPSVTASAAPSSGTVPLSVSLNASAIGLNGAAVSLWEWDFDGDGEYDQSQTSPAITRTYIAPGRFFARVRLTADNGLSTEDVVEIVVEPTIALSISQDTIDTDLDEVTSVNTVLGGTTTMSVVIENTAGDLVRTLVATTERVGGNYSDVWDGRDNAGGLVGEGQYRAILIYEYDGNTERLDLGLTTGGRQYNPSRTRIPSSFQPYANNPLVIDYTLNGPAEVTAFMGRFNVNTRLLTFFQRDTQGRGTHRITWHGENNEGQLIHPPAGDRFLFGIFAYELPDNAIFVRNRIDISALAAEPPIYTPTGRSQGSEIRFTMSKAGAAEIKINDARSGVTRRTVIVDGLTVGENVWEWDGRDDNRIFVAPGSYRIGVTGNDALGGKSLTQYTLQRIYY